MSLRDDLNAQSGRRPRVLVAEDDPEMRRLVSDALRADGYDVMEVADGARLGELLTRAPAASGAPFDVVLSDVRMPGGSALDACDDARRRDERLAVVLMTAFPDDRVGARAASMGALLLAKPFRIAELRACVRRLLAVTARA